MSDGRSEDEPRELTPVEARLLERAMQIHEGDPKELLFQHTVLCQAYFPYRDPKEVRCWERRNGSVFLLVEAGRVFDQKTEQFRPVGLPYGAKSRLLLAHINSRALKSSSRVVSMEEESFTSFVKSMQNPLRDKPCAPNGRELRDYKEHLTRLSVARLTLAVSLDVRHAVQVSPQIVERIDLTWERDERQRLLWPETITLTNDYWKSLQKHAIPLDARALAALSHNAMALDIYQWLAQRLHRIRLGEEAIVKRFHLHQQFGEGYKRERKFWEVFKDALRQVLSQYRAARVDVSDEGVLMRCSPPPVPPTKFPVPALIGRLAREAMREPEEPPAGG